MLAHAVNLTFCVPRQYEQNITDKQQLPIVQPGRLVFFLAQVYADTDAVCTARDICSRGWCPPLTTPALGVVGLSPESPSDRC